jgi:hypothetical protein
MADFMVDGSVGGGRVRVGDGQDGTVWIHADHGVALDAAGLAGLVGELTRRLAAITEEDRRAPSPASWASVPREVRQGIAAAIRRAFGMTPEILAAACYLDGDPEVISVYRRRAAVARAWLAAVRGVCAVHSGGRLALGRVAVHVLHRAAGR